MITEKTYETVRKIASHGDGFQWNPYSTTDINRCAGRMLKKKQLKRNKGIGAKWPFLITADRE